MRGTMHLRSAGRRVGAVGPGDHAVAARHGAVAGEQHCDEGSGVHVCHQLRSRVGDEEEATLQGAQAEAEHGHRERLPAVPAAAGARRQSQPERQDQQNGGEALKKNGVMVKRWGTEKRNGTK